MKPRNNNSTTISVLMLLAVSTSLAGCGNYQEQNFAMFEKYCSDSAYVVECLCLADNMDRVTVALFPSLPKEKSKANSTHKRTTANKRASMPVCSKNT